jgi:putative effector of murein hydrolase
MLVALTMGSVTAVASAVLLAKVFGLDRGAILALAPKSSTAAIAMGIAEKIGAEPALTAVLVILTGISGAIMVNAAHERAAAEKLRSERICSGTDLAWHWHRASLSGESASRYFAGIALCLNGLLTSLLVPLLLPWLLD